PCFLATEDAELEGAPAADAAKVVARKLLVVLELKPVDQAVFAAVGVHRVQKGLAVEVRQLVRAEAAAENGIELIQLGAGQELPVRVQLLITLLDFPLD